MRSIRRSLTLYFLALLGLGLGAAAILTDPFVGRTLDARREAANKLIEANFNERCREAEDRLDAELLNEAQTVYSRVLVARTDIERRRLIWLSVHEALFEASPGRPSWWLYRNAVPRWFSDHAASPFDEALNAEAHEQGEHRADLQQINTTGRSGGIWASKSMGAARFPMHDPSLDMEKEFDWIYDHQIVNGVRVRRLVFKNVWGARFGGNGPGGGQRSGGPGGGQRSGGPGGQRPPNRSRESVGPPVPQERGRDFPGPFAGGDPSTRLFIFIHCARPVAVLDPEKARFAADRDGQLGQLAIDIRDAHNQLRIWLAGIGGATFLAIVIGGPLMIRRGLAPIRSLSEAVSRVSEKDFRLPIERDAMSHELLPIHARLTDTLDELRRAFEREKQAVADISHELRTPVAGLLATIDVVLRRPRTADQYRTALEESRAIGRQLAGLVERVMTLATLDAGADRTRMAEADLSEMAAGCAAVIRNLAAANGLTFEADLPGPVVATTDPDKLREVVTNLLHNAIEYNRPGGSIRLAVRQTDSGGAEVEVADTGIGMTADVRSRIFERFYRADSSRHAAGAHAGLGLSIVKEYMDRLGGTITVDSEAGVGSTFRVTLPATPSRSGGLPVEEPEAAFS